MNSYFSSLDTHFDIVDDGACRIASVAHKHTDALQLITLTEHRILTLQKVIDIAFNILVIGDLLGQFFLLLQIVSPLFNFGKNLIAEEIGGLFQLAVG